MMEKKTIQEIASILVEKNGLQQRDAEQFAQTMFGIIREGLEREGQVKVRGLGTFKIIEVEARESVSVMTGERVLIQGHDKITFTPDATMKELVNKPFSQFETVVLNEGVVFDDMKEETKTEPVKETLMADPAVKPAPQSAETEKEPVREEAMVTQEEEEPVQEEPVVTQKVEEPKKERKHKTQAVFIADSDKDEEEQERKWWPWILLILLLMAASAAVGYYYGWQKGLKKVEMTEVSNIVNVPVDSTAVDSTTVDSTKTIADSVKTTAKEDNKQNKQTVENKKQETKPIQSEDNYAKADPRLRYGAYRIVGEDFAVKVRSGETTARIAKRTLGADMECYIEAFNGINSNTELKEGQVIKIPKLELKKKKR